MLGFQICHLRKDPKNAEMRPESRAPLFLFETCLRKVWIAPEGELSGPNLLQGAEAYTFVLEVISGLQSPIFGETEILGQFKNFLETHRADSSFGFFLPWSQQLQEDAKQLRTQYLQGQGQHSYGSLLRKKLVRGEKLCILGAGQLTEALLPWLAEQEISLWARDVEKARQKFPSLKIQSMTELPPENATLIVAAPLSEPELARVLSRFGGAWVDLREKNLVSDLRPARVTLAELYQESFASQEQKSGLKDAVQKRIREIADLRMDKAWFRPQGWEDVCAS